MTRSPYVTDFIKTWVENTPDVKTDFIYQNIDQHEDCDVDTYMGVLMDPIDYPETRRQELPSRRQREQTSNLYIRQFASEIAQRDPNTQSKRKTEKQAQTTPVTIETEADPINEEPLNSFQVQVPCHLRPATESDVEAIAAIYNHEIAEGYKVMDTRPIKQDDFYNIYSQCMTENMPFIVAVAGWHGTTEKSHQEIIGFSLITAVGLGIAGSYDNLSRIGGKLFVIVKPGYRRKGIGTALIDILITNCTGWYISKGGYQFVNSTHSWISAEFGNSPRKWWYLEMEAMIRSGESEEATRKGEEFQWIYNFLEDKFDLRLKHYDEKCFYEPRQMNWLDKLTFRRTCRTVGQ
ncbi:hypothetical protein ONZ43_g2457 [Nemania bipapillata]|uniref:Uncharacterized protein n=1 Tax=Nemania bipapillata TaxID=110536 RepID=A0ACC2J0K9_9PEZI|nr:hypothetical protein ONZ43_g2457 [Nemania bipapillata]